MAVELDPCTVPGPAGRCDDEDSLFGDQDSLFGDEGAAEDDVSAVPEPLIPAGQRLGGGGKPTSSGPPPSQPGHAPAQLLLFPTPPASSPPSRQQTNQLLLPSVPDPPGASFPAPVGHTSGDHVVSPQVPTQTTTASPAGLAPAAEIPGADADLDADLEALWYSTPDQDQAVNTRHSESLARPCQPPQVGAQDGAASHTTGQGEAVIPGQDPAASTSASALCPQTPGQSFIPAGDIPGFIYGNSKAFEKVLVPRRIDLDPQLAVTLLECIHFCK